MKSIYPKPKYYNYLVLNDIQNIVFARLKINPTRAKFQTKNFWHVQILLNYLSDEDYFVFRNRIYSNNNSSMFTPIQFQWFLIEHWPRVKSKSKKNILNLKIRNH